MIQALSSVLVVKEHLEDPAGSILCLITVDAVEKPFAVFLHLEQALLVGLLYA